MGNFIRSLLIYMGVLGRVGTPRVIYSFSFNHLSDKRDIFIRYSTYSESKNYWPTLA